MTAPSALPGLDAIRRRADHLPLSVPDRHDHVMDVVRLVAAVEAAAEFMDESCMADECDWCDRCLHGYGDLRAALAPFRVRDVTADEVPQKLIDDVTGRHICPDCDGEQCVDCSEADDAVVRAAGLATAHLGDEVWDGGDR